MTSPSVDKKHKKKKHKKERRQKESEEENVVVDVVDRDNSDEAKEKSDNIAAPVVAADKEPIEAEDEEDEPGNETGKKKRKRKRKRKTASAATEDDGEGDNTADSTVSPQDAVSNTVFVEGIPFDATRDDLEGFFLSKLKADDIVEMRLPTWQDTGRLRGFGHVRFASTDAYQKALALSGQHLGKRYLTIQPAKEIAGTGGSGARSNSTLSLEPPEGCHTLFVNNLPYSATAQEIADAFNRLVSASKMQVPLQESSVRIARNSVTRQSKGFAYVDFDSMDDLKRVAKATAQKPVLVGGRQLRLDYDTGRIKGSYRTESGRLWTKEQKEQDKQR
ncbi:RNA-binding region RNP-1 containing protein [Nitzschia inconspicua]|uniref:RNA-binding region RNP-1 containing protein n=1 Tax=Nitzschia inconspicua TaxID=303405 RepID=A0A9K3PNP5_9STRA|nr:RNA-binding region RNP-1 containing protein [Nitzschia inconspicua]